MMLVDVLFIPKMDIKYKQGGINMAKMRKCEFIMYAYFPEDMHPEDILDQAEGRFGKNQGNEIILMRECGLVERK